MQASITRRMLLLSALSPKPNRKGPVAFHYAAVFDERAVSWYSKFEVLVIGGVLAAEQSRRLREAGTRNLVLYDWSSAFYANDPISAPLDWQSKVRRNGWALNREPVSGGAAETGRGACWYDFANPQFRRDRAAHLAQLLTQHNYQGLFFDTLGWEQLPQSIQAAFTARYPGLDYNRCQASFLTEVRRQIGPAKILFLNQGYRHAGLWLPCADYDLTESYFTGLDGQGGTRIRPWDDPSQPWEAIKTPLEQLVVSAARRFPNVRFIHLNYAAGPLEKIRQAIWYSYACAKLWNHEAYLVAPGAEACEEADCYFADLGRPLDDRYHERSGKLTRRYEGGTIAVEGGRGFLI